MENKSRAPDLELTFLAAAAALPLYVTAAIDLTSLLLFHAALLFLVLFQHFFSNARVPPALLNVLAVSYLIFYPVDGFTISHSLIKATAHLLFFIAFYQAAETGGSVTTNQRILIIFLIFVASVATSTHFAIIPFILLFTVLLYRQLIQTTHRDALALAHVSAPPSRRTRAAAFYLLPTLLLSAMFFPMLPRVRNPFVRGLDNTLGNASTGFSESIDFSEPRAISPDPRVVARVWMSQETLPFFTPLRLRGGHYDRYAGNRWTSERIMGGSEEVRSDGDGFILADPGVFTRVAQVQQQFTMSDRRLHLPSGTHRVEGLQGLEQGPRRGSYFLRSLASSVTYEAYMSPSISEREAPHGPPNYPVAPGISALAREIAGETTDPRKLAARIETHLSTTFEYLTNTAVLGRPVSVEQFLLSVRKGNCEHFAAGMVLLLAARGVNARVVGGYYGGELNPLTGYFVIRQRDAHAWVEVHDGTTWLTYDPTPAQLRPGSTPASLLRAYLSAIGESVTFFWDRYILTFGLSDQVNLLINGFQELRQGLRQLSATARSTPSLLLAWAAAAAVPALLVLLLAAGAFVFLRQQQSVMTRLIAIVQESGLTVTPAMTARDLLFHVQSARPSVATEVQTIVDIYERDRFSGSPVSPDERSRAMDALRLTRQKLRQTP